MVPAAQLVQVEAPAADAYCPARQLLQLLDPVMANFPEMHAMHDDDAVAPVVIDARPAGQVAQLDAVLPAPYCPAVQAEQAEEPLKL